MSLFAPVCHCKPQYQHACMGSTLSAASCLPPLRAPLPAPSPRCRASVAAHSRLGGRSPTLASGNGAATTAPTPAPGAGASGDLAAPQPRVLTLQDSVAIALERNRAIQIAQDQLDIAQARVARRWLPAASRPELKHPSPATMR